MIFKIIVIVSIVILVEYVSQSVCSEHESVQVMVKSARDSQVGRLGRPKCSCANLNCVCCFQAILFKSPPVCVRTSYNVNELLMAIDVEVDGKRVGGKAIGPEAVPICIPAAPVYVCLSANRVLFSNETAKICFTYSIKFVIGKELYTGHFPCFHMENGKFSLSYNRV